MRNLFCFLTGLLLLCFVSATAQTRSLSGKITDNNGVPIDGASILIKGTSRGKSADSSGNFTITVKSGDILVFSATNYASKEIKVSSQASLYVSLLPEDNVIEEVVVTALGIRRTRNSLPYSAQTVGGDEISKVRSSSFITGMSGRASGIEIKQNNTLGGSANVVIRGNKSLIGNNQALFVVDGVPVDNSNTNTTDQKRGRGGYDYGNAAADINPDDIESVNILKGAAASALYGSRAANGVVMITTKKGRKGTLGVTVNAGLTVSSIEKSTFPKYQDRYGAGYGYGYDEDVDPKGWFFNFDVNGDGVPDLVTPTTEDASWGYQFNPTLQVYQWDAFDPSSPNYGKATPWIAAKNSPSAFFEKPLSYNTSVYLDGGSDRGTFKLGYTRSDEKGVLPNSSIVKDLVNFGGSYNVADNLIAGATINFSKIAGLGRYGTGYSGDHATNLMTGFREWWQTNVDVKELKAAYDRTGKNVTWNPADPSDPIGGVVPAYWNNPYWVRYRNFETDGRSRYFGNAHLTYKITPWLDVMGRVSLDSYDEMQEERVAVTSLEVPYYSKFLRSFREYNYDLLINVNRDLSPDMNLKATVGSNIRRTKINSTFASTNGGLSVPDIYALTNTRNPMVAPPEIQSTVGVDGYFATATLGYRDYLFLDASGRMDKSSTLPKNDNTYFYYSGSAGFVFSKLIANAPWLSYGKFRTNYAQVGNSPDPHVLIDYYAIIPSFNGEGLAAPGNNNSISALIPELVLKNNPTLKPEKTKAFETGVEMSFFNSRLGFDVTYYNSKTTNQIVPAPVSRATGFDGKYINVGEVDNHGWELSLYGTPVKSRDFSWSLNLNWTKNTSKVAALGDGIQNFQIGSYNAGVTINAALNEPYGTIRGEGFVYKNGQKLVNADGYYVKSGNTNDVIGNIAPDWLAGITNTFKYKNLSLSFLIDVRKGGDVFSLDMYYGLATGLYPETAGVNELGVPIRNDVTNDSKSGGIINPGITDAGTPNTVRADISTANGYGTLGYVVNPAAAFVYDASYVKLRDLTLTYSLPESVVSKMKPFKGLDISLFGRNLWLIHKNLPYADPEEGVSSGNLQGYQVGAYPMVRAVGANLKFRF
ncbi:SusC/RagA family TonB-linked outer membrane protein [Filimonas effusa]|uniref:SusC/RagA family TonB-linked outer membrane protein n=1 Tax=Filimonas effusa TaxID=2508721 RepID=A0A4Q1D985_9BACT|nr:SusC/RagA family TonB-linked outer membrane protein [Filimonas effusa]RXK85780.1 SusC/RagA family TonB-linked outer membrane protein [Filimonas effusa]